MQALFSCKKDLQKSRVILYVKPSYIWANMVKIFHLLHIMSFPVFKIIMWNHDVNIIQNEKPKHEEYVTMKDRKTH